MFTHQTSEFMEEDGVRGEGVRDGREEGDVTGRDLVNTLRYEVWQGLAVPLTVSFSSSDAITSVRSAYLKQQQVCTCAYDSLLLCWATKQHCTSKWQKLTLTQCPRSYW